MCGQITQGALRRDDGAVTEGYGPVGNDAPSSRIGAEFEADIAQGLTFGAAVEVEYQTYASNVANLGNRGDAKSDFADDDLRKLERSLASHRLGTLWQGQGDMASTGSAEVDLSGTTRSLDGADRARH